MVDQTYDHTPKRVVERATVHGTEGVYRQERRKRKCGWRLVSRQLRQEGPSRDLCGFSEIAEVAVDERVFEADLQGKRWACLLLKVRKAGRVKAATSLEL